jgi:hypothetical protein
MHIIRNLNNNKFELVQDTVWGHKVLLTLDTVYDLDDLANAVLPNRVVNRVNPSQYTEVF